MTFTPSSVSSSASRRTSLSSTAPPPLLTPDVEYPNPPLMAMVAGEESSPCSAAMHSLDTNALKPAFEHNPSPSPTNRKLHIEALSLATTIKDIQEKSANGFSPEVGSDLKSTPTSELGRYDYPFPEAPAHQPATSPRLHHHRSQTLTSRSATTPTAARPARPADGFYTRPPRLGRRGSIASGQISRLAARLPDNIDVRDRPRSTSEFSSSAEQVRVTVPPTYHPPQEKRRCASSSSLSNLNIMATTALPTDLSPSELARPTLGSSSRSTTSVPQYSVHHPHSSTPSTMSRTVYVQPATWSRAPLSFQHSPMPAPIPPSLLARRGSVPANTLLGLGPLPAGGWSNSVYKTVYHTPAVRPRKMSGERKVTAARHSPQASLDGRTRGTHPALGTSPVKAVPAMSSPSPANSSTSSSDRSASPRAPSLALPSPVVQYPAQLSPFVPNSSSKQSQHLHPGSRLPSGSVPLQTIPSNSGAERD